MCSSWGTGALSYHLGSITVSCRILCLQCTLSTLTKLQPTFKVLTQHCPGEVVLHPDLGPKQDLPKQGVFSQRYWRNPKALKVALPLFLISIQEGIKRKLNSSQLLTLVQQQHPLTKQGTRVLKTL